MEKLHHNIKKKKISCKQPITQGGSSLMLEGFLYDKVLKIESAVRKTVIASATETFKTLF